ncbi:exodeoxyribonuclease VII large subunit [Candidatus Coxiella mudrowiae]|uniref:exodeoxyribonuclease VII large subunit n=1 Tax=Candidatus Coxiella mudrowiae TaxID=2054173 RepID=UPI000A7E09F3|nr:exodeoxyribonuclease VII large subunit [Candidatus Coxiella mudrowiae]
MDVFIENQTLINPSLAETVYTISQLNAETRVFLEERFQRLWITGEISNLSQPSSGHFYFSLKDERAQVRCAFFRNYCCQLNFIPENGHHVLLQASKLVSMNHRAIFN